ncbi:MAG: DUF1839 family protein [Polyangiaceae bacterium]|nr:DUF1839 family protein [Polyangiaceae bacterium]
MARVFDLDPKTYVTHGYHRNEDCAWPETNCYVDLWIELLHGAGFEPLAACSFFPRLDFEGEQWTFFKFDHADLYELYGIEVLEHNIWKPMAVHAEEQTRLGRPFLVEMDGYFLPDTHGSSYRTEHVKTTVAINQIDRANRSMEYFHNKGLYRLEGDDYDGVFREGKMSPKEGEIVLPTYVEIAKFGRAKKLAPAALVTKSMELFCASYARKPETNPITAYRARFAADMEWLLSEPAQTFHLWAFSTLRQVGANFEIGGAYLDWLSGTDQKWGEGAALSRAISSSAKAMQFKMARAIVGKRAIDTESLLSSLENAWQALDVFLGKQLSGSHT